jgi:hypothetical protein
VISLPPRSAVVEMPAILDCPQKVADAGKCPDVAKNEIKLSKYAPWANYDLYLAGNIERASGHDDASSTGPATILLPRRLQGRANGAGARIPRVLFAQSLGPLRQHLHAEEAVGCSQPSEVTL